MTLKNTIPLLAIMISIYNLPASAEIINIPNDYPTIQEGIDAANEGDTVLVEPGLYEENIILAGPNIVLASFFLTTSDTTYISSTIIDGASSGAVVRTGGLDTTAAIVGFTIQNGYNDNGAGISCFYSSLIIRFNIIKKNSATYYGGGIYCWRSEAIIRDNTISGNFAYDLGGGIACENSDPEINHNDITENSSCFGGGIGCYDFSNPTIKNNTIVRNTADP